MKKWIVGVLTALGLMLAMTAGALCEETVGNWTDFVVEIDGVNYALPAEVSAFADNGWALSDGDTILEPTQYAMSQLKKGGEVLTVYVINMGIDDRTAAECLIGGVKMDQYDAEKGAALRFAGFALGDDQDALQKAWGAPSRTYDGSTRGSLTYEMGSYQNAEIGYDAKTGQLIDITVRNFTAPEGYNDAAYAAEVEIPQSVTRYVAPTELSDDLMSFTFRLGETVYQLPVPVSVMAENGWALNGTEYAPKLAAHDSDFGWKLQSGEQELENVGVFNDSPKANTWYNGMVIQFRVSGYSPVDIELPGGITLNLKMAELDSILADAEFEKKQSGDLTYYTLEEDGNTFRSIEIVFKTSEDKIMTIEVQCWPE